MQDKYYLRVEDNGDFGFIIDGMHDIKKSDIKITNEDYNSFFELQSQGKQFKIKTTPTGTGLFDYLEEYAQQAITDTTPTQEDRLAALELALLEVL